MAPKTIEIDSTVLVSIVNQARRDRGRCTVDDVAEGVGVSRNTAWRRLREAVDAGYIESLGRGGYRSTGEKVST